MFNWDSKGSEPAHTPSGATSAVGTKTTSTGVPSIIRPDTKIVGELRCAGEIQIDGTVEGDIDCRLLTVGESADVEGSIIAEAVRIAGKVTGQVKGKNVVLERTARVSGDITHENLTMEAGAEFEGHIRRMNPVTIDSAKATAPRGSITTNGQGAGRAGKQGSPI